MTIRTSHERRVEHARLLRRSLLADRVVLAVLAGSALWLAAFAVATVLTGTSSPAGKAVGDVVFLLPELAVPVLTLLAARRLRGRQRVYWLLLGGFATLWLAGDTVWSAVDLTRSAQRDANAADPFYLASYAFALTAIVLGVRISWSRLARSLLDAAVVAAALAAGSWHALMLPLVQQESSLRTLLPALAYPVLDVVTLFLLLALMIAAESVIATAVAFVAASFAVVSITDSLYTYFVVLHGDDRAGAFLNIGWEAQSLLFLVAAVVTLRMRKEAPAPRLAEARDIGLVPLVAGVVAVCVIAGIEIRRADVLDAGLLAGFALAALVVRLLLTARAQRELARDLERALQEQERLAISDPLTGLHNRRFFDQSLELEVARAGRGSSLGLLLLDLDHFKWINDRHGHQVGDDVLVEVARRLVPAVRGGDLVARYGGEEFVVLLPDTSPARMREVAERCRRAVSAQPYVSGTGLQLAVTVSVGGANLPEHAGDVDELVHVADKALYRAKALGRDQVQVGLDDEVDVEVPASSAHEFLQRLGDEIDRAQGRSELSRTMSRWAELVAREMGLDTDAQRRCSVAARFHDIGKIAIPASILRKREGLTPQEWELVREHPEHGARLVALVPEFRDVAPLIRDHHERPDGTGYPRRKRDGEISEEAAIVSVCDAWAAMRTPRAYRPVHTRDYARDELERCAGTQFDAGVVDAFLTIEELVFASGEESLLDALAEQLQ
jgi:diguanylate cyclase (GGDEF)-like protein